MQQISIQIGSEKHSDYLLITRKTRKCGNVQKYGLQRSGTAEAVFCIA